MFAAMMLLRSCVMRQSVCDMLSAQVFVVMSLLSLVVAV